jgi:hypothetical protein
MKKINKSPEDEIMEKSTPVLWIVIIGLLFTFTILADGLVEKSKTDPITSTAEIKFYDVNQRSK